VAGGEASHAGRVDEDEPVLEELSREEGLGADHGPGVGPGDPPGDRAGDAVNVDRHLLRLGQCARGGRGPRREQQGARRLSAVADLHRHRRGHVVVHRAYRRVDQGVDELALALLELADHENAYRRVREPASGVLEPGDKVGAPLLLAQGPRASHEIRCCHRHEFLLW
jgi:hypothetical protein